MSEKKQGPGTREKLIMAGTELFRRQGYTAARVDQVCEMAGTSKGSFFHYFSSKEELAKACLEQWDAMARNMEESAGFRELEDPMLRLQGRMEFYIRVFANPQMHPSCLAGTTVQEVADSMPVLRDAANLCFVNAAERMGSLIDAAAAARGLSLDGRALARLWMATLQGSMVLAKASGDNSLIVANLRCQRDYILGLLGTSGTHEQV